MFRHCYRGKRILITGNTGFKGSWLTAWLQQLGAEIHGIADTVPSEPAMFEVLGLDDKIIHHKVDVRDADAVLGVVKECQPDLVFHLAAQSLVGLSYAEPADTMAINVMGTVHLLEALRKADKPCTAIMITSDKCYENVEWTWGYRETDQLGGKDPYSASKGAAELMIHSFAESYFLKPDSPVRLASTRAGNVIGGGDWAANRIVPDCVRAWSRSEPVTLRRPEATRPWQHVLEPLSGYLALGAALHEDLDLNGESFNFGPPTDADFTVLELLQALAARWPGDSEDRFVIDPEPGFSEAGLLKLNCDKALHRLHWKPALAFQQTATLTAAWYNAFYNEEGADLAALTAEQIAAYIDTAQAAGIAWAQA